LLENLVSEQARQRQYTEAQFKAGAADLVELLTARVQLASTELARLESQQRLRQASGALEDAIQDLSKIPAAVFLIPRPAGIDHHARN
jgi:outer membrane protein TolC